MFLAIILYEVIIPKVSAFCSVGVDKTESFGIINSWAASSLCGDCRVRLSAYTRHWVATR
jgi:hypothetical protein